MIPWIDGLVHVHLQRVHGNLRHKRLAVEAAEHVGALENGELGLLDLIAAPSIGGQLLLGNLKGVSQQGVILLDIAGAQIANLVFCIWKHTSLPVLCWFQAARAWNRADKLNIIRIGGKVNPF